MNLGCWEFKNQQRVQGDTILRLSQWKFWCSRLVVKVENESRFVLSQMARRRLRNPIPGHFSRIQAPQWTSEARLSGIELSSKMFVKWTFASLFMLIVCYNIVRSPPKESKSVAWTQFLTSQMYWCWTYADFRGRWSETVKSLVTWNHVPLS